MFSLSTQEHQQGRHRLLLRDVACRRSVSLSLISSQRCCLVGPGWIEELLLKRNNMDMTWGRETSGLLPFRGWAGVKLVGQKRGPSFCFACGLGGGSVGSHNVDVLELLLLCFSHVLPG